MWKQVYKSKEFESIFFFHGFPEDSGTWKHLLEHFEDYNVYCIDIKDFVSLDTLASDFLKQVQSKHKNHFVAHDLGGFFSLYLADYLKKDLTSITLMNSSTPHLMLRKFKNPKQLIKSWYILVFQVPGIAELTWNYLTPIIAKRIYKKDEKRFRDWKFFSKQIPYYRKALSYMLSKPLTKIEQPTLIIDGASDPFLYPHTKNDLELQFQSYNQIVLNGGHWLQDEFTEKVATLIKQHIKSTEQKYTEKKYTEGLVNGS